MRRIQLAKSGTKIVNKIGVIARLRCVLVVANACRFARATKNREILVQILVLSITYFKMHKSDVYWKDEG